METRITKKEFQLSVADTGIGMTEQELECAFNAFRDGNSRVSQRFGGLGLGLTIGKNLVELHHGKIHAASPGRNFGSTITITFPVAKRQVATPKIVSAPPSQTFARGIIYRILLVEDHGPTREALNQLLSRRHHLVKTAGSVSEALACAALNDFDVVISDVGLPDGNGAELFIKLKTDKPHLKGIALTGFGMEEDIHRSNRIGFSTHLTKPVSIEALEKSLEGLIPT